MKGREITVGTGLGRGRHDAAACHVDHLAGRVALVDLEALLRLRLLGALRRLLVEEGLMRPQLEDQVTGVHEQKNDGRSA